MHRPELPAVSDLLSAAVEARPVTRAVILEDIVDHTNVGAIFRSVAALGADVVLVTPRCADPLYRRSVRVSMGTVFQVPWTRLASWPGDLAAPATSTASPWSPWRSLRERCRWTSSPPTHPTVLRSFSAPRETGSSPRTLSAIEHHVRIPMSGGVDSLNVAAASAVALWALRAGASERAEQPVEGAVAERA